MNIQKFLFNAQQSLSTNSDNARLDAEILLSAVLKKPRSFILAHKEIKLNQKQLARLNVWLKRRLSGEPLAYILGHQEFYGLDFKVNNHVLIPRPETELLVEETFKELKSLYPKSKIQNPISIIDLGTGSGCLIITLAKLFAHHSNNIGSCKDRHCLTPHCQFLAVDNSPAALTIAKQNAKLHGVDKKIKFLRGDLLTPLLSLRGSKATVAISQLIIMANLPYVPSGDLNKLNTPLTSGLKFEPRQALDGGPDGLKYFRKFKTQLARLKKIAPRLSVQLYLEIGYNQASAIKKLFTPNKIIIKKDLANKNRLIIITL